MTLSVPNSVWRCPLSIGTLYLCVCQYFNTFLQDFRANEILESKMF